jgi:uncharacterized protein (TIGR00299 family) protein
VKTLYLDIFSGISGDMLVGALIDLGVDPEQLRRELAKLQVDGYHLHVTRGAKASISGVKFDVHLEDSHLHPHTHGPAGTAHAHPHDHGHAHSHAHDHPHATNEHGPHGGPLTETSTGHVEISVFETGVPPRFRLYFSDKKGRPQPPLPAKTVALETLRPGGKRQAFKFKGNAHYLEATDELPEPHEFQAVLTLQRGKRPETRAIDFVEAHHHHHHHEHTHDASEHGNPGHAHDEASHAHAHEHEAGRDFAGIKQLISRSGLSSWVKEKAIAVFRRIAVAEGKIHGLPPEQVHFHEVGAVDSIVDIVGACAALELLGKPRVLSAPVVEGTGWIRCAHGRFPIPAPATLAILGARGIALTQCEEPHELVTPTGAALLAELAEAFGPMQGLVAEKIGFGLGTRDNQTRPNVLRAVLGETRADHGGHDWQRDTVAVLETNLDDLNAEILGHFIEQALAAGALDVFHTPIQMKKNRPGVLLTVLCAESDADKFSELMLRETSSFGVRRHSAERRKLERQFTSVQTPFGKVTVKLGRLDGKVIQAAPEYESCKQAATQAGVPLKTVYEAASKAIEH